MTRQVGVCKAAGLLLAALFASPAASWSSPLNVEHHAKRIVVLEIDGLGTDLLFRYMREKDSSTGKSRLPWFSHVFAEQGIVFENFYTRGISLSTPSWSLLQTGQHTVIRGNVEYDRFTGRVYDYLNMFPFYLGYARKRQVDMPGVEVLDRAGIPLIIDSFPYAQRFQSFQLFQRGVRWTTLRNVLTGRFSSKVLVPMIEGVGTPSLDEGLAHETEQELDAHLKQSEVVYLDFFTPDADHEGHATNQSESLLSTLRHLDELVGRIWTQIQQSPLAHETVFVAVSDHGMNNVPEATSETFSLPDLLNSPDGGGHHVVTNRHQLSDYKLVGLDPLVERVITPSTASFYLQGQSSDFPTAWLDLDGNERASVHLRNSDLNKLHILLQQLSRRDLPTGLRQAAVRSLEETISQHRTAWSQTLSELQEELRALAAAAELRRRVLARQPQKWSAAQREAGEDKVALRVANQLQAWERELSQYDNFAAHLERLLALKVSPAGPFIGKISDLIPPMELGENNTVWNLRHYVVGPSATGLALDASGRLDEERSFRCVDYPALLARQRVRNNPQPALSSTPVDFTALRLPAVTLVSDSHAPVTPYWLYSDEQNQLLILVDATGRLRLEPACLIADPSGVARWTPEPWHPGLPLHLFEDPDLALQPTVDRARWLSSWHTESEWFAAIHKTLYSNAVIGVVEQLSPVSSNVPGPHGLDPILLRYERRRRELVQTDFLVLARNHWNFNVRNFNPGGNHGSFFRISTHSVWMMAGAGLPVQTIAEPYDSLNYASTVRALVGKTPPMPDRVVPF